MYGHIWIHSDKDNDFFKSLEDLGLGKTVKPNSDLDDVIIDINFWSLKELQWRLGDFVSILEKELSG